MGSGVPAGAGAVLNLRTRLLAAAAGIVAVSLILSGALSWFLVRNLEFQSAQDQLDRVVLVERALVVHQECSTVPVGTSVPGSTNCKLASAAVFADRLTALAPSLGVDRLVLLDRQRRIVFDSGNPDTAGQQIALNLSRRVSGVQEATPVLNGQSFIAAAVDLAPGRDPLGARYLAMARTQSSVQTTAAQDLLPRLFLAGAAALVVALLLVLFVSRSLTRPLSHLSRAAEDIAGGNYSRRVGIRGTDEIGTLGTAFDRMAEAVERARKVQREFLANVSHELKTPLTSLIGFSQALVDGSLHSDEEKRRAATVVHEESERVLRMSQELLDLARVEGGSISMHVSAVDLGAQLQQELEMIRPRAGVRSLRVVLDVPTSLPPVAADPDRLHQVLDNLLDNAVKYAPEGSRVLVSAHPNGEAVEVAVSNPLGSLRPDPERMFERFYRADPSRSAAAGGVGLGLAISQQLISAMSGRMWAAIDGEGDLNVMVRLPCWVQRPEGT